MKKTYMAVAALLAGCLTVSYETAAAQAPKQPTEKADKKDVIGIIERLDPRFDTLVPKDAQLEKIADGFIWTEGAVWHKAAKCLLFSDIPNNVIIKWKEGEGTSEFLKPSGYTGSKPRGGKAGDEPGSNGLMFDTQGRLTLCEHGDRRVTRIEKDGTKTVLADNYLGKRLNSPNDLAIHPNGDVYFTDPPYGLDKGAKRELDFMGVFRISAKDGKIALVSKDLRPNGIALTPDAKKLYVTNGNAWMVFPVNPDGSTGQGKVFVDIKKWPKPVPSGGLDGMKCDSRGNIFATRAGRSVRRHVPRAEPCSAVSGRAIGPSNLCFGGEDRRRRCSCASTHLHRPHSADDQGHGVGMRHRLPSLPDVSMNETSSESAGAGRNSRKWESERSQRYTRAIRCPVRSGQSGRYGEGA